MGGKFHLKLNTGTRPIANKYREGKMKSTLKRELKAREAVKMETIKVSSAGFSINIRPVSRGWWSSEMSKSDGCFSVARAWCALEEMGKSASVWPNGAKCGGR